MSAEKERDEAMAQVEANANNYRAKFSEDATAFVLARLAQCGPQTSEELTDAAKAAGVIPHDDRAFGPVYARLARRGTIRRVGDAKRRKGHCTTGGSVWSI